MRSEWLQRERSPWKFNATQLKSAKDKIGHAGLQLVAMIRNLSPDGTAVQVERPRCGYERVLIRRREEPLVSLRVIEPGEAANLSNFRVLQPNFCEQCSRLRMTLVRTTAGKRAAAPVA